MAKPFNWRCPYCGRDTTITDQRQSLNVHYFGLGNKHGGRAVHTLAIVCPNEECKEFMLNVVLGEATWEYGQWSAGNMLQSWRLIPSADVKIFPDYVPSPILADYREAAVIRELSPKASATLARRCLQGMIRDFWGVSKARLVDEIDTIKDKVDPVTWNAIDAVRNIGNIGAHMERDINLVVDVDPDEAALLIGLIETLITEWYVNRHEREERMTRLVAIAADKKSLKSGGHA